MEEVELVIKIPKEAYQLLKNEGVDWLGAEHILNAVSNGTVIPKGHGNLDFLTDEEKIIIANEILNNVRAEIEEYKSRQLSIAVGVEDLEKGKQIALEYVLTILDKYKAESVKA